MDTSPHSPTGSGEPYRRAPGTDPYGRPSPTQPPGQHGQHGEIVPAHLGGYESPRPPAPVHGPTLMTIGDIAVTQNQVITPAGGLPLRGSVWTVTDMTRVERTTPTWAIITAVLVFWWTCLLGLLFLLAKEERVSGHIQVTVRSGDGYHSTIVPARNSATVAYIHQQVGYVRSLAV